MDTVALEVQGIRRQELVLGYRAPDTGQVVHERELLLWWAGGLGVDVTFERRGRLARWLNLGAGGVTTGDRVFDDALRIRTHTPEPVARLLADAGLRAAVLDAAAEVGLACGGEPLRLEGDRCRVAVQWMPEDGDGPPAVERSLTALFVRLAAWGDEHRPARDRDRSALPDLTAIFRRMGRLGVVSARFQRTILDSLEPLRALVPLDPRDRVMELGFHECRIRSGDLAPLAELDWLRKLVFRGVPEVADLGPLSRLASLTHLTLYDTSVADLSPLAGLTDLVTLLCQRTAVADLGPLRGLENLRGLGLAGTRVEDLSPLGGLVRLEELNLSGLTLADLSPLFDLPALRRLHLRGASVPGDQLAALRSRRPALVVEV